MTDTSILVRLFLGQEESGLMVTQRQATVRQECSPLQPVQWVSLTSTASGRSRGVAEGAEAPPQKKHPSVIFH